MKQDWPSCVSCRYWKARPEKTKTERDSPPVSCTLDEDGIGPPNKIPTLGCLLEIPLEIPLSELVLIVTIGEIILFIARIQRDDYDD